MYKIVITFLLATIIAQASVEVVRAAENIKYKALISKSNVFIDSVDKKDIKSYCQPVLKKDIITYSSYAKSHIKKGDILCKRNIHHVNKKDQEKILFNFGAIQIEKNGKVIRETKDYIKIRNSQGDIEKIYKSGTR